MTPAAAALFKRDRLTWATYAMLAYYMFVPAALGPLLPFLRAELSLSYTVGGLHLSAFAGGGVLTGLVGMSIIRRWGRAVTFWGGGIAIALGTLALVLAWHPALTIASVLVIGFGSALLLVTLQAMLSDRHGAQRTIALTEANVAASVVAVIAPLCVGWSESWGLSWRGAALVPIVGFGLIVAVYGREPIPPLMSVPATSTTRPQVRLPGLFWLYWAVIFLSVAVEWCLNLWAADYLISQVGLSQVEAATTMSVFFLAAVIGRVGASLLARVWSNRRLLWLALGMTAVGFPIFWLAPSPALSVIGLFCAGLGVANFYPLTLTLALDVVPDQADRAGTRIVLGTGSAMLSMPLLLGWIADQLSLQQAYSIVVVLLALAVGGMVLAGRWHTARPELAHV